MVGALAALAGVVAPHVFEIPGHSGAAVVGYRYRFHGVAAGRAVLRLLHFHLDGRAQTTLCVVLVALAYQIPLALVGERPVAGFIVTLPPGEKSFHGGRLVAVVPARTLPSSQRFVIPQTI